MFLRRNRIFISGQIYWTICNLYQKVWRMHI